MVLPPLQNLSVDIYRKMVGHLAKALVGRKRGIGIKELILLFEAAYPGTTGKKP